MKWNFKVFVLKVLILLTLSSCQSAKELHYFKSGDNYYRLNIKECSFASKSRYLSGYFSDRALELYFSEMKQPDSSKVVNWINESGITEKSNLVLILSTNSNTISEQIGSFASNEETLETIARLANKDKIDKANNLDKNIKELALLETQIMKLINNYLETIVTSKDPVSDLKDFALSIDILCKDKLTSEQITILKSKLKLQ